MLNTRITGPLLGFVLLFYAALPAPARTILSTSRYGEGLLRLDGARDAYLHRATIRINARGDFSLWVNGPYATDLEGVWYRTAPQVFDLSITSGFRGSHVTGSGRLVGHDYTLDEIEISGTTGGRAFYLSFAAAGATVPAPGFDGYTLGMSPGVGLGATYYYGIPRLHARHRAAPWPWGRNYRAIIVRQPVVVRRMVPAPQRTIVRPPIITLPRASSHRVSHRSATTVQPRTPVIIRQPVVNSTRPTPRAKAAPQRISAPPRVMLPPPARRLQPPMAPPMQPVIPPTMHPVLRKVHRHRAH